MRAATEADIRKEFRAAYPGTAEAKKKEYGRVTKASLDRRLIASREVGGVDFLWLTGPAQ